MYTFWKQYVNVYMHGEILKSSQPTSLLIICLLIFSHGNTDFWEMGHTKNVPIHSCACVSVYKDNKIISSTFTLYIQ